MRTIKRHWWEYNLDGSRTKREEPIEITDRHDEEARALVEAGYFQVSRKYRSVARGPWPHNDAKELSFESFEAFRAMKQQDAEEKQRLREARARPQLARLVRIAREADTAEVAVEEMLSEFSLRMRTSSDE